MKRIAWNKGLKTPENVRQKQREARLKNQNLNEIRECKDCKEKKIVTEFTKGKGNLYRYQCKDCRQKGRRTGKPNTGKFQKGHSHGKRFEKGHIPWYKEKGLDHPLKGSGKSESKNSVKTRLWTEKVKERDGWKCVKCGSKNRVAAHHIIPWKDDENLRFELSNGICLCISCHGKEEGFQKGHITILSAEARQRIANANRGRIVTEKTRKKMSEAKKGKPGPMTGKKMSDESKIKMRLAKLGKPSNRMINLNRINEN